MNKTELKHTLQSTFDFQIWKRIFDGIFSTSNVEYFSQEVPIDAALIKSGGQVGTIRLDDGRSLAIFKFEVADNIVIARNRRGLRDIAAKYVDQSLIHGALVLYYSSVQDDYRLTYVAKQTSFNSDGQLIKNETAPKRYTFLLGPNETCTTAANRLYELAENKRKNGSMYLADVTEAFSVERLNKEFFDGYKKQYSKFLATLSDTKQNRDYVKKLLGRIVFLQFLQKKGWMGVQASRSDWSDGDKNYLANLVGRYKGNERLLSDVLEPLFFNTLNEPRPGDLADPILGDSIKIPYLNGGLFDKDNIDKLDIDFPYDYFKNLMDFFSQYNFTIDENDPDDSEVGIDPEMLGHIFENLLEDNKDKGAFYTPKEIVQYMSRESVIQYLLEHTKDDLFLGHLGTQIADLINRQLVSVELQDKANAQRLYDLLAEIKVCDPAIGSGAFPMGVLNVLYHTRHLLHAFAYPKKDFVAEEEKRDIIQNNIYGVDIEQGAVDIARLRFWLALVVDAEKPQPLPNLDYKIMQGNSLLEQFMGYDLSKLLPMTKCGKIRKSALKCKNNDTQSIMVFEDELASLAEIRRIIRLYFTAKDHIHKYNLQKQIDTAIRQHIKICGGNTPDINAAVDSIDMTNKPFFLWHLYFADVFENGGFDIIIGNPPYRAMTKNNTDKQTLDLYYSIFQSFKHGSAKNLFTLFIELGVNILNSNGTLSFIVPEGLYKTRSYAACVNYMHSIGSTLQTVSFTNYVFDNVVTGSLIFLYQRNIQNQETKHYHYNKDNKLEKVDNTFTAIIEKISHNKKPLNEVAFLFKGMVVSDRKSVITTNTSLPDKFLLGKDMGKWRIKSCGYTSYKDLNIIGGTKAKNKHDVAPRIIIRRTGDAICSTLLFEKALTESTLYSCWPKQDSAIDIKALIALINSTLLNWYNQKMNVTNQQGYPQILMTDLQNLPITVPYKQVQKSLISLVDKIYEEGNSNINEIEAQIDYIVYHLYDLTYDEVLIVDPQTSITREEYESIQL